MKPSKEQIEEARKRKANLKAIADKEGFVELIESITKLRDSHLQVAKDGKRLKDLESKEQIQLSNEERLSNLDRAAGIDEVLFHISLRLS